MPQERVSIRFYERSDSRGFTVNGVAHVFRRAVLRAGITTGDVSLHTLRHTALSRMIASGIDDFTVMALSGHQSIRMLERYTHPTTARKIDALESFSVDGPNLGRTEKPDEKLSGGRQEARTPDLRVANERWERPYLVARSRRRRSGPRE